MGVLVSVEQKDGWVLNTVRTL